LPARVAPSAPEKAATVATVATRDGGNVAAVADVAASGDGAQDSHWPLERKVAIHHASRGQNRNLSYLEITERRASFRLEKERNIAWKGRPTHERNVIVEEPG